MVGLIVLGVLLVYFFIVGVFIRLAIKAPEKQGRRISKYIAIALVLIPTWDIPIDGYLFHQLCKKEGGIFVDQKVGISKNYYLQPGAHTKKVVVSPSGDKVNRLVKATGNELNIKMLEGRYNVENYTDSDYVRWGKVVKFTTTVSSDEKLLGKSVRFIGGTGWFLERFSWATYPGSACPVFPREPDLPSSYERLLYKIFYKLED